MKRIIKFTGLLTLILFSFFYTDKVVEVIRENDKLMIELEQVSDNYKVNAINGIISGDTIKPGINGKKVNIEKSYKQMKEKGIFDENLIKYDKIVPKINMSHNQNKYIIGGNKERNMVSIVFILDNKKYLKKVEDLSISKDVMINYFVTYDYLVDNSTNITKMTNSEFYNYGSDGEYSPDNILFANNLISRITDNEAIYCLTKYKNEKVIKAMYFLTRTFPEYSYMCNIYPFLYKAPVLMPVMWIVRLICAPVTKMDRIRKEVGFWRKMGKKE